MSVQAPPRVLIDACLLVKGNVSNILFDLAQSGLIRLHWTPEIGAEFLKNWPKVQLQRKRLDPEADAAEYALAKDKFEAKAKRRLKKFKLMQPEWEIPSWNYQTASAKRPPKRFGIQKEGEKQYGGVHRGDYHVALASAVLADDFPEDEIWLATENITHLPPKSLHKFRVWCIDQGLLLEELLRDYPQSVETSLRKTMAESQKPKLTEQAMVDILADENGLCSETASTHMQQSWGCQPAPNVTTTAKPTGSTP